MLNILGSIVALVTPMTNNGEVDYQDLDSLIDFHLDNNTDGLVVLGTTGESVTLADNEKEKITKRVVKKVAGKIPVIVGTGDNATSTTIIRTNMAQEWGADAALVVTPYYNKPSQDGLLAHYNAIVSSTSLPIMLYNVPSRTACDMLATTSASLSKNNNIIGLKEAVATPERIDELVSLCDKNFVLLSGDDQTVINFLKSGGQGVISVTANLAPNEMATICKASKNNNWQLANQTNSNLETLHKELFVSSNPVPVKWAMFHLGLIKSPYCRLPLLPLDVKYHSEVISALESAGINRI